MKTFIITQSVPSTQVWHYKVEAKTQNEAIGKVVNGEVECIDYIVEADNDEEQTIITVEV